MCVSSISLEGWWIFACIQIYFVSIYLAICVFRKGKKERKTGELHNRKMFSRFFFVVVVRLNSTGFHLPTTKSHDPKSLECVFIVFMHNFLADFIFWCTKYIGWHEWKFIMCMTIFWSEFSSSSSFSSFDFILLYYYIFHDFLIIFSHSLFSLLLSAHISFGSSHLCSFFLCPVATNVFFHPISLSHV